jgi:hypothetical protein
VTFSVTTVYVLIGLPKSSRSAEGHGRARDSFNQLMMLRRRSGSIALKSGEYPRIKFTKSTCQKAPGSAGVSPVTPSVFKPHAPTDSALSLIDSVGEL